MYFDLSLYLSLYFSLHLDLYFLCVCVCVCVCVCLCLCLCLCLFVCILRFCQFCVCGYGQQQPGDVLLSFVFNASTAARLPPTPNLQKHLHSSRNPKCEKEIPVRAEREIQNVKNTADCLSANTGLWGRHARPEGFSFGNARLVGLQRNKCARLSDQEHSQFSPHWVH